MEKAIGVLMEQNTGVAVTQPVKVDVGSVEAELASLWRLAIGGCVPETTAPATRAILSNLLVYASSHEEAKQATDIITDIIADHPARTIVADAECTEPEHQADVTMVCSITEHGRRLCGEEIRLHPHGLPAAALSMIMPVLVPELPVYLWTPGDLTWDEETAHQLIHISDHWVFDCRKFEDCPEKLRSVVEMKQKEQPIAVHDLAWVSLSQWREAVAQHFDPVPAREYLRGVQSIEIKSGGHADAAPAIEGLLMACWLICRLQWREPQMRRESGEWIITARADNSNVQIVLNEAADKSCAIEEVRLEAEVDSKRGVFRSAHSDRANEVWMEADAPDLPRMRRTIHMPELNVRNDLRQVLDTTGADKAYEQALPALLELVEQRRQLLL